MLFRVHALHPYKAVGNTTVSRTLSFARKSSCNFFTTIELYSGDMSSCYWNAKGFLSGSSDTSIDRQREAVLVRGARTPIAEKENRLFKNIAKFFQNSPFQLAKFCILDAVNLRFFFCKKNRGDRFTE